jgi:hypothetical protein
MVAKWKVRLIKRTGRQSFEAEFTDPRTGHRHRKTLGTVNRREAEREAGRIEAELREGQWIATRKTKWKDFREKYETEGMFDLAPASVRVFQNAAVKLEKLVQPSTLQSLTEERLNSFTTLCLSEGLSKHTIGAYLRHLKASLRWAVSQKLLMECPVIRMPKGTSSGKAKGRAVTGEEFERMLAAVPKVVPKIQVEAYRFLLQGLWWSGLRLGETSLPADSGCCREREERQSPSSRSGSCRAAAVDSGGRAVRAGVQAAVPKRPRKTASGGQRLAAVG